jgi:hypothetical protein
MAFARAEISCGVGTGPALGAVATAVAVDILEASGRGVSGLGISGLGISGLIAGATPIWRGGVPSDEDSLIAGLPSFLLAIATLL